jgi:O-antigen ligase
LLFLFASGGLPRWVRVSSLLLVCATLVGTYSREGWLMFLLGVVLYGWTKKRNLVIVVVLAAAVISFAVPGVHNRVFSTAPKKTLGTPASGTYASLDWRIHNWSHLLHKYSQSPVIGFGLGEVEKVNPYNDPYTPGQGFPSHNSLLQILIEGGIALLVPWLVLLGVILTACSRMARQAWELREYARVTLVVWITVLVAGMVTEDTIGTTAVMYIVLAMTGCLMGARRNLSLPGVAQPEG